MPSDEGLAKAHAALDATRPTAVNLRWALDRVRAAVRDAAQPEQRADAAWREADAIVAEDGAINRAIGEHGLALLRQIAQRKPGPIHVMTHCNAGALATCALGNGDRAGVPRSCGRACGARLGVGDAPAAAGREPHGLGDGAARRSVHALCRRARAPH